MPDQATKKIPKGYKQTEVGLIPSDRRVKQLRELLDYEQPTKYLVKNTDYSNNYNIPVLTAGKTFILGYTSEKTGIFQDVPTIIFDDFTTASKYVDFPFKAKSSAMKMLKPRNKDVNLKFVFEKMQLIDFKLGGHKRYWISEYRNLEIDMPDPKEQAAIATALSDVDALIASLEKLIAKKRAIKQGAMQELLTGKRRLPGFSGGWEVKTIKETADCLDNLRIPLNDNQRSRMQGDIPYCGANGVLDYVDDYVVDDDIILIAEDGGYFDEYEYRPIAYRMIGKCWVNNHAHILKAKASFNQGFLFYSLVHKNILRLLASGTRAKLNKSEMYKIEIDVPPVKSEQIAIADIFSDMDAEISMLEQKLAKYRMLKQGMMQVLLTGRIRLV